MADTTKKPIHPTMMSATTRDPSEGVLPDPKEARIAFLEDQVARLVRIAQSGTSDVLKTAMTTQREEWFEEQKLIIQKGNVQRTQELADKLYQGKHTFQAILPDGNLQPMLRIRADHQLDVKGRYFHVCGIVSAEKEVIVVQLPEGAPAGEVSAEMKNIVDKIGWKSTSGTPQFRR